MVARRGFSITLFILAGLSSGCIGSRGLTDQADDPLTKLLAPAAWPASSTAEAPRVDPTSLAREIHRLVNDVRAEHGLKPLAWANVLLPVAAAHSRDMAEHAYFSHTNRQGEGPRERVRRAGLPTRTRVGHYYVEGIGENLFLTHRYREYRVHTSASGQRHYEFDWKTAPEIAREAVMWWMTSPGHRINLLSPLYGAEAIGVVVADNGALFITQNLAALSIATQHEAGTAVRGTSR